jgi:Peptidase family C54
MKKMAGSSNKVSNESSHNGDRPLEPMADKHNSTTPQMRNGDATQNPTDSAMAAGYKYDNDDGDTAEEYPEDEDQYYPYDATDEATESSSTSRISSQEYWKDKTFTTVVVARTQERRQIPLIYMLGSMLHPIHDHARRKHLEKSLYWFTYRYDFAEIKPYNITTDAGWGCMLRSAQMLLAHTLRVHFSQSNQHWYQTSSSSSSNNSHTKTTTDNTSHRLLTWFVDLPSTNTCFYSLHNMCAAGLAKHQVLPGEWYGPGTACYVLRDLVAMHQEQQPQTPLFRVHVATDGTVYRQVIEDLMTRDGQAKRQREEKNREKDLLVDISSHCPLPLPRKRVLATLLILQHLPKNKHLPSPWNGIPACFY